MYECVCLGWGMAVQRLCTGRFKDRVIGAHMLVTVSLSTPSMEVPVSSLSQGSEKGNEIPMERE